MFLRVKSRTKSLTQIGLIAGLYAALTLLPFPISFGPVQCRPAEALTVLAAYTPTALPGLTVGCLIANLCGLSMGASAVGAADLIFGPLATLLAAWLSYRWRACRTAGLPVVSTIPPVVCNALAVGTALALTAPTFTVKLWLTHIALVAAGQLIACVGGGLAVAKGLEATGLFERGEYL